ELVEQRCRRACEELLTVLRRCFAVREHEAALARVRPLRKTERRLVGVATNDQGVDTGEEVGEAVVLVRTLDARQKVERAVGASDEAIDAGGDEDGTTRALHGGGKLSAASP